MTYEKWDFRWVYVSSIKSFFGNRGPHLPYGIKVGWLAQDETGETTSTPWMVWKCHVYWCRLCYLKLGKHRKSYGKSLKSDGFCQSSISKNQQYHAISWLSICLWNLSSYFIPKQFIGFTKVLLKPERIFKEQPERAIFHRTILHERFIELDDGNILNGNPHG